jgi:hypothetical protein
MQFQNSANATGRNKAVKEASSVINRESGGLQHSRHEDELRSLTFEAFLSGTASAPSFGFGSNVNVVVASPRESGTALHPEARTPLVAPSEGTRVGVVSALRPTARLGDSPPSHSAIFSGLGTSPQCALEAIKSSFGTLGKIQALAAKDEGLAPSKRTRR